MAARLEGGDLLWLLGSLCQIGRVPFDPDLIAQEFPPPHSTATLHEAARALGFRTGERRIAAADLPGLLVPASPSACWWPSREHLGQTINRLKGRVTILFITHHIPRGLQADEVFSFGGRDAAQAGNAGTEGE